jgi:hypothetical protein
MAELVFKTALKEVLVTIDDKQYKIMEMTGSELSNWRKTDGSTISVDDQGRTTITGLDIKNPELELLALCLCDAEGNKVPTTIMEKWSATVLQGLYKIAQDLNGLTMASKKKQEKEAKNS